MYDLIGQLHAGDLKLQHLYNNAAHIPQFERIRLRRHHKWWERLFPLKF